MLHWFGKICADAICTIQIPLKSPIWTYLLLLFLRQELHGVIGRRKTIYCWAKWTTRVEVQKRIFENNEAGSALISRTNNRIKLISTRSSEFHFLFFQASSPTRLQYVMLLKLSMLSSTLSEKCNARAATTEAKNKNHGTLSIFNY